MKNQIVNFYCTVSGYNYTDGFQLDKCFRIIKQAKAFGSQFDFSLMMKRKKYIHRGIECDCVEKRLSWFKSQGKWHIRGQHGFTKVDYNIWNCSFLG